MKMLRILIVVLLSVSPTAIFSHDDEKGALALIDELRYAPGDELRYTPELGRPAPPSAILQKWHGAIYFKSKPLMCQYIWETAPSQLLSSCVPAPKENCNYSKEMRVCPCKNNVVKLSACCDPMPKCYGTTKCVCDDEASDVMRASEPDVYKFDSNNMHVNKVAIIANQLYSGLLLLFEHDFYSGEWNKECLKRRSLRRGICEYLKLRDARPAFCVGKDYVDDWDDPDSSAKFPKECKQERILRAAEMTHGIGGRGGVLPREISWLRDGAGVMDESARAFLTQRILGWEKK